MADLKTIIGIAVTGVTVVGAAVAGISKKAKNKKKDISIIEGFNKSVTSSFSDSSDNSFKKNDVSGG